jgi:predicted metal-dependent hydrolase
MGSKTFLGGESPARTLELETPGGVVFYTLTRKRVRNLNLRIRTDGSVAVSAPPRMAMGQIERFILQKAGWILRCRQTAMARPAVSPCPLTKDECLALFAPVSERIFPLFCDLLGGRRPVLKVRQMKTRWGSCNPKTHTITLNMQLAEKPAAALEYVVLHEYVHFLHHNHQPPFHAEMARLMPDYKARRRLLKG